MIRFTRSFRIDSETAEELKQREIARLSVYLYAYEQEKLDKLEMRRYNDNWFLAVKRRPTQYLNPKVETVEIPISDSFLKAVCQQSDLPVPLTASLKDLKQVEGLVFGLIESVSGNQVFLRIKEKSFYEDLSREADIYPLKEGAKALTRVRWILPGGLFLDKFLLEDKQALWIVRADFENEKAASDFTLPKDIPFLMEVTDDPNYDEISLGLAFIQAPPLVQIPKNPTA